MTVNELLLKLEVCRNRGMGEAKVFAADTNNEIFEIGFETCANIVLNDDGEFEIVLPPNGREAILLW